MLKKMLCLGVAGLLGLGSAYGSSMEAPRRLHFGASLGGYPLHTVGGAFRWAVEMGFRVTDRLAFVAEVTSSKATQRSETTTPNGDFDFTTKSRVQALSLSILYFNSFAQGALTYLGLGGGFHRLKSRDESRTVMPGMFPQETSVEWNADAFAPHVCIGLEAGIRDWLRAFGEARYVIGTTLVEREYAPGMSQKFDLDFGGAEVKIGFRVYFRVNPE